MSLDDYNGVRSTINEEYDSPVNGVSTRGSIFIFGTATRGEKNTPIRGDAATVKDIFGEAPLDSSFDTSLVRGFYETKRSLTKNDVDIFLIRVGDTKTARIDLYENDITIVGDLAYTPDDGVPAKSFYIEAQVAGAEYNAVSVMVSKDSATLQPNHVLIELPDGSSAGFNLSVHADAPGVITKVSSLCDAINATAAFQGILTAGYTPLLEDVSLTVTADADGNKNKIYDIDPATNVEGTPYMDTMNVTVPSGVTTYTIPDTDTKAIKAIGDTGIAFTYDVDEDILTAIEAGENGGAASRDLYAKTFTGRITASGLPNFILSKLVGGNKQVVPQYTEYSKLITSGIAMAASQTLTVADVTGIVADDTLTHSRITGTATITDVTGNVLTLDTVVNPRAFSGIVLTLEKTVAAVAGATTDGSKDITGITDAETTLFPGMVVTGTGIDVSTTIDSVSGTTVTLVDDANATGSQTDLQFVGTITRLANMNGASAEITVNLADYIEDADASTPRTVVTTVAGDNIAAGTVVTSISGTTVTLDQIIEDDVTGLVQITNHDANYTVDGSAGTISIASVLTAEQYYAAYDMPATLTKDAAPDALNEYNTENAGFIFGDTLPYALTVTGEMSVAPVTLQYPTGKSWGDKIVRIVDAYQVMTVETTVNAGEASAELPEEIQKDMTEGSPGSIDDFIYMSDTETLFTAGMSDDGKTTKSAMLFCSTVTGWDSSYSILGAVDGDFVFTLYFKGKDDAEVSVVDTADFTVDPDTGEVVVNKSISLGDAYYASYYYKVAYAEAKYRTDLLIGDARSYFIFGDQIIFGAEQPANVMLRYITNASYASGEVVISDIANSIVEFNVPDSDLPDLASDIFLTIQYEPELPAPTGKVLVGGVVQSGALTGGSDGRVLAKKDYTRAIEDAMVSVDLYPRRRNVVMGMYLDDVELKPNYNTGVNELQPLNMAAEILPYIDRASKLTQECDLTIPVRPLATLTQDAINDWIDRLTTIDVNDSSRPANIIDGYSSFRADCPVGVFRVTIPEVNNGQQYLANPACIYAGFKASLDLDVSAINQSLPPSVQDVAVRIFNADVVSALNAKRYTAAVMNSRENFVWADAPTLAGTGSRFDRQFVRDAIYEMVSRIRMATEKYIGKPMTAQYLIPMRKDAGQAALTLVEEKVISDVFVDIESVPGGQITGKTRLRVKAETAREIRNVDIVTSVTLGGGEIS